jgi:hypothetical protein
MIITPIKSGCVIKPEVIKGVSNQSLQAPWLINSMEPFYTNVGREANINLNRHYLQEKIKNNNLQKNYFIFLLDSDVVLRNKNSLYYLKQSLELDEDCVCKAILTKQTETNHVVTACAVIRYCHYELIRFWENPQECQCLKIAKLGRVDYIPFIKESEIKNGIC